MVTVTSKHRSVLGEVASTDAKGGPLRTPKSGRTKATIVAVARQVFEQRGYQDTRVADIVKAAGTGHGTFYRYFKSKEDLFRALSELVRDGLIAAQRSTQRPLSTDRATPAEVALLEEDLRTNMITYLNDFRQDARLIEILDEVAVSDPEVRRARIEVLHILAGETTHALRYMVDRGVCTPDIDIEYTALMIRSMVDRFAYTWFVHGEPYDEERAIDTLVASWKRLATWIEPDKAPATTTKARATPKRSAAPTSDGRQVAARKSKSASTR